MRIATSNRTETTATPLTRGLGEHDLWDLWLLDEAEEVPCGSVRTFLHYLSSEGTKHCEMLNVSTLATGFVDVVLTGPVADDESNHLLHYRLTRGEVGRLEDAEKGLLVRKLTEHYPVQGDKPHQKARLALTAVGFLLA